MSASSATPDRSARAHLRDETRAAHEAVDAAFGAFDLRSASGYARFLRAHAVAFLPLERGLDRFGAERLLPDWPSRRRSDALVADLADLGLAPGSGTVAAIESDAAAWGLLYVLEGSRFGGRMIARGLAGGLPRRYIGAVHQPGGWAALVTSMDVALSGADARREAIDAANAAFARFERAARESSEPR